MKKYNPKFALLRVRLIMTSVHPSAVTRMNKLRIVCTSFHIVLRDEINLRLLAMSTIFVILGLVRCANENEKYVPN